MAKVDFAQALRNQNLTRHESQQTKRAVLRKKGSVMLNSVISIVKEAAKLAVNAHYTIKNNGSVADVVTSADIAVQNYLKQKLQALIPSSGFLGEESDARELNAEYIWIVDPIDGTMNFTRALLNSAISVALQHNGTVELGVVYNFFTDDLYCAEKGKGAFNNGTQIHVSNRPFSEGLLCTAFSAYRKQYAHICFEIAEELFPQCNDVRRLGSCAMELCYIAAGKCDFYFELGICCWDSAAGELILREAGGDAYRFFAEDFLKKPLPMIAANNTQNLQIIFKVVDKYFKKYNVTEIK